MAFPAQNPGPKKILFLSHEARGVAHISALYSSKLLVLLLTVNLFYLSELKMLLQTRYVSLCSIFCLLVLEQYKFLHFAAYHNYIAAVRIVDEHNRKHVQQIKSGPGSCWGFRGNFIQEIC